MHGVCIIQQQNELAFQHGGALPGGKRLFVLLFQLPDDPVDIPLFAEISRKAQPLSGNFAAFLLRRGTVCRYGCPALLPWQKVNGAVAAARHHQNLNGGVPIAHGGAGLRVRMGAFRRHPVVQHIALRVTRVFLRREDGERVRILFLQGLFILVLRECRKAFRCFLQNVVFCPAVCILHQGGDVLRQTNRRGKKRFGAP